MSCIVRAPHGLSRGGERCHWCQRRCAHAGHPQDRALPGHRAMPTGPCCSTRTSFGTALLLAAAAVAATLIPRPDPVDPRSPRSSPSRPSAASGSPGQAVMGATGSKTASGWKGLDGKGAEPNLAIFGAGCYWGTEVRSGSPRTPLPTSEVPTGRRGLTPRLRVHSGLLREEIRRCHHGRGIRKHCRRVHGPRGRLGEPHLRAGEAFPLLIVSGLNNLTARSLTTTGCDGRSAPAVPGTWRFLP